MKKFAIIAFLALPFLAFSQASSGAVQIAGEDDLPRGYFVKAQGYLPGDSIAITNAETGVTLQTLNLGTLDGSTGVMLLISQESAESLGLSEAGNITVDLLPRNGDFDRTVSGIATINSLENLAEEGPEPEEQGDLVAVEPVEEPVADFSAEATATPPAPEEEVVEALPVPEAEAVEEPPVPEEEMVEEPPVPMEDFTIEDVIAEENPPPEDYENVEDTFQETRDAVEQPSPLDDIENEKVETEEVPPLSNVTEEEPEPPLPEDDEYAPIILIPTEPETPEPGPEESEASEVPEPVEEPEPAEEPAPPVQETLPSKNEEIEKSFSKYIVQEADLITGSYYIQIAALKNEENIENAVAKYSMYPLALVEITGETYRILIGPLNVDEYSSVLTKVKAEGYTDAFVRKI